MLPGESVVENSVGWFVGNWEVDIGDAVTGLLVADQVGLDGGVKVGIGSGSDVRVAMG